MGYWGGRQWKEKEREKTESKGKSLTARRHSGIKERIVEHGHNASVEMKEVERSQDFDRMTIGKKDPMQTRKEKKADISIRNGFGGHPNKEC